MTYSFRSKMLKPWEWNHHEEQELSLWVCNGSGEAPFLGWFWCCCLNHNAMVIAVRKPPTVWTQILLTSAISRIPSAFLRLGMSVAVLKVCSFVEAGSSRVPAGLQPPPAPTAMPHGLSCYASWEVGWTLSVHHSQFTPAFPASSFHSHFNFSFLSPSAESELCFQRRLPPVLSSAPVLLQTSAARPRSPSQKLHFPFYPCTA